MRTGPMVHESAERQSTGAQRLFVLTLGHSRKSGSTAGVPLSSPGHKADLHERRFVD